jgi:hypothetical protein
VSNEHIIAGTGHIRYLSGTSLDSLQPAQAGADVTSLNTAADTGKVNGVAASSISPIASLMPSEAAGNNTALHALTTQTTMPGDYLMTNTYGLIIPGLSFSVNSSGLSDVFTLNACLYLQAGASGAQLLFGVKVGLTIYPYVNSFSLAANVNSVMTIVTSFTNVPAGAYTVFITGRFNSGSATLLANGTVATLTKVF